jgi:hypothetical protein
MFPPCAPFFGLRRRQCARTGKAGTRGRDRFRDKGSNLDLRAQNAASCRLDDPGPIDRRSVHRPGAGDRRCGDLRCHARLMPSAVFHATRLPFDPGSPAAGCAAGERPSYVEELWSPSLGRLAENRRQKLTLLRERDFQRDAPRVFLSQAGPRFRSSVSSSWASPFCSVCCFSPSKRRRRPVGSPSLSCYAASGLAVAPRCEG